MVKDFPTLPVHALRTQSKEALRGKAKARRKQGPDPLEKVSLVSQLHKAKEIDFSETKFKKLKLFFKNQ